MTTNREFEIKGGADEFEAAVIAVVLDHLAAEEDERKSPTRRVDNRMPEWVRAIHRNEKPYPPSEPPAS